VPALDIACVVNRRDQLGETPLWHPRTQRIWWLDIERPRLQSVDPRTGDYAVFPFDANYAGGLAFHADGGFLVALDNALHRFDPVTKGLTPFVEIEPAGNGARLNDGRCDRRGRLWIGTMDAALRKPLGSVYRVDPDGAVTRMFGGVIVTNSITTSPDDRVLYVSDTRRYVMWAFDLDPDDGTLTNRRIFVDYTGARGRPDGACVDADGCVWNAAFAGGCVNRFTPTGRLDRVIDLPVTNPTCVCFGDHDYRTLYITTATKIVEPDVLATEAFAGALLAIRMDVSGLPEASFGGGHSGGPGTRFD
jgi:sugar lactone lactonase YvrE